MTVGRVALLVGVAIGLVQSATQLQEQTVAFVPKFIGVGIAMLISATGCCRP